MLSAADVATLRDLMVEIADWRIDGRLAQARLLLVMLRSCPRLRPHHRGPHRWRSIDPGPPWRSAGIGRERHAERYLAARN